MDIKPGNVLFSPRLVKYFSVLLALIAILYLYHGFSNLISNQTHNLPTDLALRYHQANDLIFNKINIYKETVHAQYPPSLYLFLSPLTHYSTYQMMDEWWAVLHLLSLLLSILLLSKLFSEKAKKYLIITAFLAFHAIPHAMGVGQISVIITGFLMGSLYLIKVKSHLFFKIVGTLLLTFALGKYSLLLPIALVFILDDDSRIPIILSVLLNILLSHVVLIRVDSSILEYIELLLINSYEVKQLGTIDIQSLLSMINAPDFVSALAMIALLVIFSVYIIRNRVSLDIWDQMAIASITARFFIYHNHYDNVMLIFILIALLKRVSFAEGQKNKTFYLVALTIVSLVTPARFLIWEAPFYGIFLIFQLMLWVSIPVYIANDKMDSTTT